MSVNHDYPNRARKPGTEVASGEQPGSNTIATFNGRPLLTNSGIPLDLNWVQDVRVNTSAVERRVQTQVARRTCQERVAGGLASACDFLHGPDYTFW